MVPSVATEKIPSVTPPGIDPEAVRFRDRVSGIANRYGQDGPGHESVRVRYFLFSIFLQTGSGVYAASPTVITGSLTGNKACSLHTSPHQTAVCTPLHTRLQSTHLSTPDCSLHTSPHQTADCVPLHNRLQSAHLSTPDCSLHTSPHQIAVCTPLHTRLQSAHLSTPDCSLHNSPHQTPRKTNACYAAALPHHHVWRLEF
jgi:hypothetical protein